MRSLSSIIQKYFPEEKVISQFKATPNVNLKLNKVASFVTGQQNMSTGDAVYSNIKKVDIIETDKRYYIDRRGFPKDAWFKFPRVVYFALFDLFVVIFNIYILVSLSYPFWILAILMYGFLGYLFLKYYSSIANIYVVDKSWITKKNQEGEKMIIEGNITQDIPIVVPTGATIMNFIPNSKGMPFIDKFFMLGKIGSNWQTTFTGEFQFTYTK